MRRQGPGPLVGVAALAAAFLLFALFSVISRWLALAMIAIVAVYVPCRLAQCIIEWRATLRYTRLRGGGALSPLNGARGFEVLPPRRPDQQP